MANPRQKTTNPVEQKVDYVHPRAVFEALRKVSYFSKGIFTDEHWDKIDNAIAEGRIYLGFPKSGSGTKGTDDPEKPFWVGPDENDKSKLIGAISPVKAEGNDQKVWARYIHVFTAFAAYTHNPDSPRIYTKDGFKDLASKVGLLVVDGKKEQAYGYYRALHEFTMKKLPKLPPVPFSIDGTKAAAVRRTFSLPGYHKDEGPNVPVTIPVLNPAKTDGDNPVTPDKCLEHGNTYANYILKPTDRADWQAAIEAGGFAVEAVKEEPKKEEEAAA